MKKLLPVLLLLLAGTTFYAQDADRRTGLTFTVGQPANDISFRRLIGSEWAALGSLGYSRGTAYGVTAGGNEPVDIDSWTLTAAARRYFANDQLRPFAEAGAGLRMTEVPGCDHLRSPYANVSGGVEYRIAPRVSIEGSAGLSYSELQQRCTAFDGTVFRLDTDSLSTFRTALSVTFYF